MFGAAVTSDWKVGREYHHTVLIDLAEHNERR